MWRVLLLLSLAAGIAPSCETTRRTVPPAGDFDLTRAEATRAWQVIAARSVVGEVVRFDDLDSERFFYSVRNPLHQELGLIDEAGRAYRYRAHQPEPTWVGTWTVLEGSRQILGLTAVAELHEVSLGELRP